ncbi:hypothetical protein CLU82_1633 [Flavobacterium sp. 5]|nr:hypothetical protein CLU82_1633 [Flavobacterium sp. 5]
MGFFCSINLGLKENKQAKFKLNSKVMLYNLMYFAKFNIL